MKKCKECGNEVSTKAASCPKCGAVSKKRTGWLTWLVAGVVLFIVLGVICSRENGKSKEEKQIDQQSQSGSVDKGRRAPAPVSVCAQRLSESHLSAECTQAICSKCEKKKANVDKLARCISNRVSKLKECPRATTANKISRDYRNNEVSADSKYENKWTLIKGTCASVDKDWMGDPVLSLKAGGYGFYNVSLSPIDSFEHYMGMLNKGDRVLANCKGAGKAMLTPIFSECFFF